MSPGVPLYNVAFRHDLYIKIDPQIFKVAFAKLVATSDNLRTVFEINAQEPVQAIRGEVDYHLRYLDFTQFTDPEIEVSKFIKSEKQKLIDISQCAFSSALLKVDANHFIWYINLHHIITDAWGNSILFKRLSEFYKVLCAPGTYAEQAIPSFEQYLSHEQHQQSVLVGDNQEGNENIKPVEIYQQKPGFETKNTRVSINFGFERSQLVKQVILADEFASFSKDLSIYQFLSAVIFTYLHKISKQDNLAVGTPIHNRTSPTLRQTSGLFVEFLPFQVELDSEESFLSLFRKVRNSVTDTMKRSSPGKSSAEANRKFNILLNYMNATFGSFGEGEARSTYLHTGHNDPRHDMVFQISDFDTTGEFKIEVDLSLNKENLQILKFVEDQFLACFDQVMANPNILLKEVEVVDDSESDFLINKINSTERPYALKHTLIHRFRELVKSRHNEIVAKCETRELTYGELENVTNLLAKHLIDQGVKPGDVVGICFNRSVEMLVGMIAIQKSGAAYLPIEPSHPIHRIEYMLEDSGAQLLLTKASDLPPLVVSSLQAIMLDIDSLSQKSIDAPQIDYSSSEGVAYVIYTSGSTGNPKGVEVTHAAITNRVLWMQDYFPIGNDDHILQKTPYTFDVSVWEFFWPLIVGARLVFAKPNGHKDSKYLIQLISDESITIIHFVPSMLVQFLEEKQVANCVSLQKVFCSGEILPKHVQNKFLETLNCELHNLYGPTEAAVDVTHWNCKHQFSGDEVPIGKTVPNTQVYLLDDNLKPVPFGLTGRLFLGGVQLAKGYINNKHLTQERFVPNLLNSLGDTLYNTGDLAKYCGDGVLLYRGRTDNQIKMSGLRIELGEIEQALQSNPKVHQATVVFDKGKVEKLFAFVTASEKLESNSLRNHLLAMLPDYMVPSSIIQLTELPLTANGKVDRKKLLKEYQQSTTSPSTTASKPSTEIEGMLHGIWMDVFEMENIDVHANFIELGGHSLMAIRLVSRINEAFHLDLGLSTIFEYPTISTYAVLIDKTIAELMEQED